MNEIICLLEIYCQTDQLRKWRGASGGAGEMGVRTRWCLQQAGTECRTVHSICLLQCVCKIFHHICGRKKVPRWFWHILRAKKHCSLLWVLKMYNEKLCLYYQLKHFIQLCKNELVNLSVVSHFPTLQNDRHRLEDLSKRRQEAFKSWFFLKSSL